MDDYDNEIIKEVEEMKRRSIHFNHCKKNRFVTGYIGFTEEMLREMQI